MKKNIERRLVFARSSAMILAMLMVFSAFSGLLGSGFAEDIIQTVEAPEITEEKTGSEETKPEETDQNTVIADEKTETSSENTGTDETVPILEIEVPGETLNISVPQNPEPQEQRINLYLDRPENPAPDEMKKYPDLLENCKPDEQIVGFRGSEDGTVHAFYPELQINEAAEWQWFRKNEDPSQEDIPVSFEPETKKPLQVLFVSVPEDSGVYYVTARLNPESPEEKILRSNDILIEIAAREPEKIQEDETADSVNLLNSALNEDHTQNNAEQDLPEEIEELLKNEGLTDIFLNGEEPENIEKETETVGTETETETEKKEVETNEDSNDKETQNSLVVADVTIDPIEDCVYNGEDQRPTVVVKTVVEEKEIVIPAEKYDVTYQNNRNAGEASVTVQSKKTSLMSFTKTATFTICKATPTVKLKDKAAYYNRNPIEIDKASVALVNGETFVGTISYSYYTDAACEKKLTSAPIESGTYYAVASTPEIDPNYGSANSNTAKLKIIYSPKKVTAAVSSGVASIVSDTTKELICGDTYTFRAKVYNSEYYIGRVYVNGVNVGAPEQYSDGTYYYTYKNPDNEEETITIVFQVYDRYGAPATGDGSNMMLWGSAMLISATGIIGSISVIRNKRKQKS